MSALKAGDSAKIRSILKRVDREKLAIARHRDRLRELTAELEQIADDADEAVSDLERATDALSRLL